MEVRLATVNSDDRAQATGRLKLEPAPAGLSLVQDVLNSAGMPVASVPDLLADETAAQAWLDASLRTWGEQTNRTPPQITITEADLPDLRDLRDRVKVWLASNAVEGPAHRLDVDVRFRDGRLVYEPRGDGAGALASLVHLEALLAAHTGTLRRLKTCMNPSCGAAFYDLSRNGTRVWHDMKTCGNAINLRASRARRRDITRAGQTVQVTGNSSPSAGPSPSGDEVTLRRR